MPGAIMAGTVFGTRQARPIGARVKYDHALLQTNKAIFVN